MVNEAIDPLDTIEDLPLTPNFRSRRSTFDVNLATAMDSVRNGIRVPTLVNQSILREAEYQRWLRRVASDVATRPECFVYLELERRGYRAPESRPPGIDFEFQVPLAGGRSVEGGSVADFVLWFTSPATVIRVQGEFFHFADAASIAADNFAKARLESEGFRVADILAQDTLNRGRLEEMVGLAILGFSTDPDGRLGLFR